MMHSHNKACGKQKDQSGMGWRRAEEARCELALQRAAVSGTEVTDNLRFGSGRPCAPRALQCTPQNHQLHVLSSFQIPFCYII